MCIARGGRSLPHVAAVQTRLNHVLWWFFDATTIKGALTVHALARNNEDG
jgi:hypothetical protein